MQPLKNKTVFFLNYFGLGFPVTGLRRGSVVKALNVKFTIEEPTKGGKIINHMYKKYANSGNFRKTKLKIFVKFGIFVIYLVIEEIKP